MTAPDKCLVEWCVRSSAEECGGDHWSSPGDGEWPEVEATAYQPCGREFVAVGPTWGEMDGLAPAVVLQFRRDAEREHNEVEDTFDLTPDEAEALAANLLRAAEAARKTNANITNGEH